MTEEEWVKPRLSQEEAEKLDEWLTELEKERKEQLKKQGLSNDPAPYKSLVRDNPRRYLRVRYLENHD